MENINNEKDLSKKLAEKQAEQKYPGANLEDMSGDNVTRKEVDEATRTLDCNPHSEGI